MIEEHFKENRQMLFISGPRQVGKTTTTLLLKKNKKPLFYFSWDNIKQKELILEGPDAIAKNTELRIFGKELPYIVFDEIHKFPKWKEFLKGLYDTYPNQAHIIVTGSAMLDFFKKGGGDSLMGRYFLVRIHPLSIAELLTPVLCKTEIRKTSHFLDDHAFHNLLTYGGYPDPYLKANIRFYNRWKNLRYRQLLKDDLRALSRVQEIEQLEFLAELILHQVGHLATYDSFAKKIRISSNTIRNWIKTL